MDAELIKCSVVSESDVEKLAHMVQCTMISL